MTTNETRVIVKEEPMPLKVARWLLENKKYGVYPASPAGWAEYSKDRVFTRHASDLNEPLGLLKQDIPESSIFYGLRSIFRRRPLIGIISDAGKKRWSMKVYGRDFIPFCTELANALNKEFQTDISVLLAQEKPGWEFKSGDGY